MIRLGMRVSFAAAALLVLVGPLPASGQQEIVARGNEAYQAADFQEAIEAYEAVLEGGFRSAGLEYNLGNAYFKAGELGHAILHWERALQLSPGDEDVRANLDLARSLTVDAVEPLPRFWLSSVASWWIGLLPRGWLLGALAAGWLALTGGVTLRVLARPLRVPSLGKWLAIAGAVLVVALFPSLVVRETGWGVPERAVILSEAVQVQSAPSAEDELTLFQIHEGTVVQIDGRVGEWVEVVLEDGKVGWVTRGVLEVI